MIGAIIGDIAGSRFERKNHKSKDFELFNKKCHPTDDSVMSLAVAKAILESEGDIDALSENAITRMQEFGKIYWNAGYGKSFIAWINSDNPVPYNSYGNGSAMRVGPCGYSAESIEEAKLLSEAVTKVTHDHPEGMKGAEAVAVAIYLAKTGCSIEDIKSFITENYYDIDYKIDEIRESYEFDVSCQGSVPVALEAFFESTDFEDAIRTAISVGGDSDTIAAIAGSVAEAYYGIPEKIILDAIEYLDTYEKAALYAFEKKYPSKAIDEDEQAEISVYDVLCNAADKQNVDDKDAPITPGGEMAKVAKGLFSAIKTATDNIEISKDMVETAIEYCYEIVPEDSEDTEDTIYAIEQLRENGFKAGVTVSEGTMRGYVLMKEKDRKQVETYMEMPAGKVLELKQVDKSTEVKVKRYMK